MAWLTYEFRGKDKNEIESAFLRWQQKTEGLVLNVKRYPSIEAPDAISMKIEYQIKPLYSSRPGKGSDDQPRWSVIRTVRLIDPSPHPSLGPRHFCSEGALRSKIAIGPGTAESRRHPALRFVTFR